jgi:hypothetical protein
MAFFRSAFEQLMRTGCSVELHGRVASSSSNSNAVTTLIIGAKGSPEALKPIAEPLRMGVWAWYGAEPTELKPKTGTGWTAGNGAVRFEEDERGMVLTIANIQRPTSNIEHPMGGTAGKAKTNIESSVARGAMEDRHPTGKGQGANIEHPTSNIEHPMEMEQGVVLEGEVASGLMPSGFGKSVYGGFTKLKFTVRTEEQTFRIRGTASYNSDLPALNPSYVVPTNLAGDAVSSFTLVRNPGGWLAPDSVLRGYLPEPVPDSLFFWGGGLPMLSFMAMPYPNAASFAMNYGPKLTARVKADTKGWDVTGPIGMDGSGREFRVRGIPYLAPTLTMTNQGGAGFLTGDVMPGPGVETKLAQPLLDYMGQHPNLLLYDWEITGPRLNSWIQTAQLVLLVSHHHQLDPSTASMKWILAVHQALQGGGNTVTDVSQTGPREVTFARRAPLGFSSAEIYWLAHWLEGPNFPSLNIFIPEEPAK